MKEVRRGPLCWAQHWFWMEDCVLAQGESEGRMLSWSAELAGGMPVGAVRRALTEVQDRHEALRTVYRRDGDGRPVQVVLDGVDVRMILVEDGGGNALTDHIPHRFDLANEPTLTAIVLVRDGLAYELCVAVHRITIDGVSWALIRDQCLAAVRRGPAVDGGDPGPDYPAWHPIDHAAAEAAAVASGAAERSVRHWERELATGPHASLPIYWDEVGIPSLQTIATLPRATLDTAAERYDVTAATIAQALLAVMCAGWTGHPSCAIGSATSNRLRRPAQSSVGRYAGMVRMVLPVDPALSFRAFVEGVHRKLLVAYKHALRGVGEITMQEARVSARVGARIVNSIFFEYHHYTERRDRAMTGLPPADTVYQQELAGHAPQLRLDVVPTGDTLRVSVCCSSRLLDGDGAKKFLAQYRDLIELVAAGDPDVGQLVKVVHLPAPWDNGNWASLRQAWINLDDVSRLLRGHPDVVTASVSVERSTDVGGGGRLVARVVTRDAGLSAGDLEEHMRRAVSDHPTALVPHRYLISPAPGATAREAAPPDGRPGALIEVFRACHGGRDPQLADTYAQAGGEFLRIPDMLDGLARAGYAGVALGDFIGLASLRALAAKLVSAP